MISTHEELKQLLLDGAFKDYDFLSRNYVGRAKYFGLGMIQLDFDFGIRLNFYSDELRAKYPSIVEEPHDHRYTFESHILQGVLAQSIVYVSSDNKSLGDAGYVSSVSTFREQYEVSCSPNNQEKPKHLNTVSLDYKTPYVHTAGSSYTLHHSQFHMIDYTKNNCVTMILRPYDSTTQKTRYSKNTAQVLTTESGPTCPYGTQLSESDCWTYIAKCIDENNQNKVDSPGYHLTDIKKGTLGEISKIQEEVAELVDAHGQDVKLMAAIELSDLYGAIDAYREKHHPHYTMNDIIKMHAVTKRAFQNGKR